MRKRSVRSAVTYPAALKRIQQAAAGGALGSDGGWLAAGLQTFLRGTAPLDQALTKAWSDACRSRRDDALRDYGDRYCHDPVLSRQAARLAIEIERYERSAWRHDRHRAEMPSYRDTPNEKIFLAFTENAAITPARSMPSSPKHLMKILGCHGSRPPVGTSVNPVSPAPLTGDHDDEGQDIPASAQRRRQRGRN